MKIIDSFDKIHRKGTQCEASAIRDIIHYYGLDLSMHEVIGLSGNLGVCYEVAHSCINDFPYMSLSGYTGEFITSVANSLELSVVHRNNQDFEVMKAEIIDYIEKDVPIMIRASYNIYGPEVYKKKGFRSSKFKGIDVEIHYIQLIGYGDSLVYYLDSMYDEIQNMSWELLKKSSECKMGNFISANEWYAILPPQEIKLNEGSIQKSVYKMYINSQDNISTNNQCFFGTIAIDMILNDLRSVYEKENKNILKSHLLFLYLSSGGMIKGNYMYRNSLRRYYDFLFISTSNEKFSLLSENAREQQRLWNEILVLLLDELIRNRIFIGNTFECVKKYFISLFARKDKKSNYRYLTDLSSRLKNSIICENNLLKGVLAEYGAKKLK